MNYVIERLSNIGVNKEDSLSKKRVTRIVNQAAGISALFSALSMFINLIIGNSSAAIIPFVSAVLFALIPYFNHVRKYETAKIMLSSIGYIATTLVVSVVDINTYTFYYFICIFAVTIVFFPSKRQLWGTLALTMFCLISSLSISYFEFLPKLDVFNPLFFGIFNVILLLLLLSVLMSSMIIENNLFQERTDELLGSINNANEELRKEKRTVEKTNTHLQQEILEREKIENSLRESNQLLREFAYVASHDMKEPLRTIGSFSGLLARKLKGKLAEDEKEYLDFITNGVSRMSILVDDLLKYAPLNNPVSYERVNLNNTIEVVKNSLNNLLNRKNVKITIGELPILIANQSQLLQLFQNLVSNGIKFNDKLNPEIQIHCTENKSEYKFSVKDNGIGIPVESQERIWKIFHRLHSRTKFEGSGIGLAVVQKVVSNHQGQIWVDSVEGKGTTFYFTIAKNLCSDSKEMMKLQTKIEKETHQN